MTEEQVFLAALDLPNGADRAAYLDEVCGQNSERRRQVEELLAAHERSGQFLDEAAAEQMAAAPQSPIAQTIALNAEGDDAMADGKKTNASPSDDGADDLPFLTPSTRPDSLGRLGHYEMLQVLGRGGFGIVFRAFDDVLQRVVAVKVMAPQIATLSPARKRFLREARSSAAVRHENVVHVYEIGEHPLPYLTMEFIPGETLQQKLDRSGPLEVPEVLRIGRQIAEGLAAAHACDLIHRDIKPGNILLEGGSQKVKITDFGLARAADDASISQSGVIAGTPLFMAPEQALGHKIDQRADLFSLGSVLYQMVSGRPPFRAPSTLAVLKRVAEEPPRPIPEIIPEAPAWLCEIIAKLHAKNPDERFQSARETADVLADCEAQLKANAKLKDYSRIPRSQPRRSGRRKWLAVAAAVLLLPVVALAVTEFAGVTHLFRGQQATTDNGQALVARDELPPLEDGWVRLFNGKDLSGWKTHPDQPGDWKVENGTLVGRGPIPSHLFSERGDFRDFHLRLETKLNATGESGVFVRCPFGLPVTFNGTGLPGGFDVQFQGDGAAVIAGQLAMLGEKPLLARVAIPPDTWFTIEVIAKGDRIVVKVNDETTADYHDPAHQFDTGHVALHVYKPNTVVHFRKIEIKKLPPSSLPPTFTNGIGMEFMIVPKGKSWLGGGKDKLGDREVEIPADFYLGKYEVTQEQWEKAMGENPSHFSRNGEGKDAVKDIPDADLKRFPLENVTWGQCQLFVAKLNKLEKETGWVYRLPTGVEWEYACRGGPMADKRDSAFNFYFARPTNTLLPEMANFNLGPKRPCEVGSYEANRLGLYDMHGNVCEWCQDEGPLGGSWSQESLNAKASFRFPGLHAWVLSSNIGLRLARVPAGATSPEVKTPPLTLAPFTDADVQRIAALPAAQQVEEVRKELKRRNPGFDGKMETKIERGVVTEFKIVTDHVTDIAPIRVFNALRVLDCNGTWTGQSNGNGTWTGQSNGLLADLTPLEGMNLAALTYLGLSDTKVTDAGMVYFKDCKNLTGLALNSTQVTDAGMACFKDCKNLTRLLLAGSQVSDAGLANFKDCKNLTELLLYGTQVGDAGLAHFKDCKKLTLLVLNNTKVSDAGLAHFRGAPLTVLSVCNTGITDLTPLQAMQLEHIRLTPKNITRGLDILRDMKSLKTIGIDVNQVWPAAEFWERYDKGEFKE